MSSSGGLATSRATSRAALAPDADAPRAARDFAARTLLRWGVPQWGEPVGLVVSELVTNAVRHAGTRATLRLVPTATGLVIEVDDAADGRPHIIPPDRRTADGGLGLAIVDRLAEAWGYEPRPDGKTVWARLSLPEAPPAPETGPAGDEILLELPRDKDLVGMVRSTVVHLAVRAGFARRDTEDLRLAADEIFGLMYAQHLEAPPHAPIRCRFRVAPGSIELAMSTAVPPRRTPAADDFGWHLLQALVDDIEWVADSGSCGVRAAKWKSVA
ncbi:MAG: ATP-binding protein [Catenulispora sp.]